MTVRYLGKPIAQILSQADAAIADSKTWEERPVIVVEAAVPKSPASTAEFKTRLWIDPSRGFAVVRRQSVARYAPGRPWHVHFDSASYGLVEASPGVWLPTRVEDKNFGVPPVEQNWLDLVVSDTIRYCDWKVNADIPASKFQIQLAIDSAVDFGVLARPPANGAKSRTAWRTTTSRLSLPRATPVPARCVPEPSASRCPCRQRHFCRAASRGRRRSVLGAVASRRFRARAAR